MIKKRTHHKRILVCDVSNLFLYIKEGFFTIKKHEMAEVTTLTFEEDCNKYLENCQQRNLREGTINHYRQSYPLLFVFLLNVTKELQELLVYLFRFKLLKF